MTLPLWLVIVLSALSAVGFLTLLYFAIGLVINISYARQTRWPDK